MSRTLAASAYGWAWLAVLAACSAGPIVAICRLAPREATMGDAQRIVYIHVAVAWFTLASFLVMAGTGIAYLARRNLAWDHWSQAAGELGWLTAGLTLLTGSFWAHEAWGAWWTWDPRLTTAFALWAIYSGWLILRAGLEDPHRRARLGAVLAVAGLVDVPLVIVASRWFRGIHPASPGMEPAMRLVLAASVAGFSVVFAAILLRRRAQLRLEEMLAELERRADLDESRSL